MCVYAYDRVLTSEFLLAALSHQPLEEVRKLSFRHVLVWSGVTSEVGPLLGLDVGHVGVCLGPLVLLLEPALFCGVASAFAIGSIRHISGFSGRPWPHRIDLGWRRRHDEGHEEGCGSRRCCA